MARRRNKHKQQMQRVVHEHVHSVGVSLTIDEGIIREIARAAAEAVYAEKDAARKRGFFGK